MDQAFAMKWADALESGEFTQTQGSLCDGSGHCCLGVACVLLGKKFVYNEDMDCYVIEGTKEADTLTEEIRRELGMNSVVGYLDEEQLNKDSGIMHLMNGSHIRHWPNRMMVVEISNLLVNSCERIGSGYETANSTDL